MFCSGRKISDVNERISNVMASHKALYLAAALTVALIQAFCTVSNMSLVN